MMSYMYRSKPEILRFHPIYPLSFFLYSPFKRTVSVISSDPPCKEGTARFTTVPLKLFCDQLKTPVCTALQSELNAAQSFKIFKFFIFTNTTDFFTRFFIKPIPSGILFVKWMQKNGSPLI